MLLYIYVFKMQTEARAKSDVLFISEAETVLVASRTLKPKKAACKLVGMWLASVIMETVLH